MRTQSDLLARVVAELQNRAGSLRVVAAESGVAYDTVLRIKNSENDPGYSKVKALATYLGVDDGAPAAPEPAKVA